MFSVSELYVNEYVRIVNKNPNDKEGCSWAIKKGYFCLNKDTKLFELECCAASNYDDVFKKSCYMKLSEAIKLSLELFGE